jgi:hypothetical protein
VPERHSSRKPVLCLCLGSSRHNWAVEEWQISLWDQGGVCGVEDGRWLHEEFWEEAAPARAVPQVWALLPKEAQDGPALKVRPHLGSLNPD